MMPYLAASIFYAFFAVMTSYLTVVWGFKRGWVVTVACWLWPVTWVIALLLSPYFVHQAESKKKT